MPSEYTSPSDRAGEELVNRRTFLQRSALGVAAVSLGPLPKTFAPQRMGIVVHSYASRWNSKTPSTSYPGFTTALDLLEHC
ncbi:MAG: twin-arginine translocation signal domain-containing protein, partial [Bacteroidetes bacterium]|nr:twin-arginine translocation signal domain-containing protein [Bacteroidota bacterium]